MPSGLVAPSGLVVVITVMLVVMLVGLLTAPAAIVNITIQGLGAVLLGVAGRPDGRVLGITGERGEG